MACTSEEDLFKEARQALAVEEFTDADSLFSDFLLRYPNSKRTDQAKELSLFSQAMVALEQKEDAKDEGDMLEHFRGEIETYLIR